VPEAPAARPGPEAPAAHVPPESSAAQASLSFAEGDPESCLRERIGRELATPVAPTVAALAAELRRRHGGAVAAVVFYGSCLRKRTSEGVLDFYVVVDGYRSAYPGRSLALANAVLPPNVFYLEWPFEGATLRSKYAVISTPDLQRRASLSSLDCRIWARFCQPAALAFVRDEAARRSVEDAAATACLTFVARALATLPDADGRQSASGEVIFRSGLRETYRAELRSERADTIQELYDAFAGRYDAVARHALETLAARGRLSLRETAEGFSLYTPPSALRRARRAWRLRRPVAKILAIAGLFKTAFTFGDWVPYVLWKMERHTTVRIELSPRQRRHPLIFGWPVILRVLREGIYR
jgi:hypothetical protein